WGGGRRSDEGGADAFSMVFDSPPLPEDTEILGFPLVELYGSADAEPLHWFGRLCDVAPDGTVTLVTGGGRAGRPDPMRDGGSLPDGAIPPAPPAAGPPSAGAPSAGAPSAGAPSAGAPSARAPSAGAPSAGAPSAAAGAPSATGARPAAGAPPTSGGPAALPLELHVTSWVFPRGHRIRLALSNAMWPMIWPTPHPASATVRLGP